MVGCFSDGNTGSLMEKREPGIKNHEAVLKGANTHHKKFPDLQGQEPLFLGMLCRALSNMALVSCVSNVHHFCKTNHLETLNNKCLLD